VLLFSACSGGNAAPDVPIQETLTIGAPEGGVPGATTGMRQPALALSQEGLTTLNTDGRVLPRLAEAWSWQDDGRALVVTLRSGVTFHDGTPLTAEVIAKILGEAIKRPGNVAQYPALADITGVEPRGERDVVLRVSRRSAFLAEDLEIPIGLPNSVGTGAFRIVRSDTSEIALERHEQYYGGRPAIRNVVIRPFQTLRTAWTSLLRSEIDMVTNVPPEAIEFVSNEDVQIVRYARRFQFLIAFNSRRPTFRAPAVRRALNLAIDRGGLITSVLDDHATPSTGPLWPQHWAYDGSVTPYGFNPSLATSLLEEAGLRARPSAAGSALNARLRFTCLIPANFTILERLALEMQKQLYNVGVDMQFEVIPPAAYGPRLEAGDFDAALIDMNSGPTLGRPYVFWRSAKTFKGLNYFGYENAEAERLFEVMRDSTNEAVVRSATSRLQQVLLDDPPALFIAWNEGARAVRRDFEVVQEPGRDPLFSISRWTGGTRSNQTR
jgi:peptide/nickel transport system substrate-binding protein